MTPVLSLLRVVSVFVVWLLGGVGIMEKTMETSITYRDCIIGAIYSGRYHRRLAKSCHAGASSQPILFGALIR